MIRHAEPGEVEAEYLHQLNLCFPGWGGKEMFDWCFRRPCGGPAADLFVALEDGHLIAGSAITYRRARRRGVCEPVAIMTGSWTAADARGRGLFKQMIAASRACAAERGCRVILGFVRAINPSGRALAAVGFRGIATTYLEAPQPLSIAACEGIPIDEAEKAFVTRPAPETASHFVYRPGEWRGQFLLRPATVCAVDVGKGSIALVERRPAENRLLDVSTSDPAGFAEGAIAAAAGFHPLTAYSIQPQVTDRLVLSGFSNLPGMVYFFTLDGDDAAGETWWFANGDRM